MNKLIKQAFTLIELLVVIAIISILSGLIVVSMSGVTQKANIAKAQVFSNSLRNSLMMNIVSEWKFEEGSGQDVIDSWGRVSSCTLGSSTEVDINDPTRTTLGCVYGNCLSFDGSDDYVDCGNQEVLKALSRANQDSSWSYWFKTSTGGEVIGKYQPFQFIVSATSGKLSSFIYNGSSHLIGSPWQGDSIVNDDKWHYVVFAVDRSGYFFVYLDGVIEGSPCNISSHAGENWAETANLYIGVRNPGSSPFSGLVDDIRIYNAVILTSQIKEQYYTGLNNLFTNSIISKEEYINRVDEMISIAAEGK
ncbi:MAG: LamG-like jellyroll fold domain-containing protein [Candidatus Paceibacterota bacterium]|jgi:prepilin-type N-terminal cleavage/methylation domain-containing protein